MQVLLCSLAAVESDGPMVCLHHTTPPYPAGRAKRPRDPLMALSRSYSDLDATSAVGRCNVNHTDGI